MIDITTLNVTLAPSAIKYFQDNKIEFIIEPIEDEDEYQNIIPFKPTLNQGETE